MTDARTLTVEDLWAVIAGIPKPPDLELRTSDQALEAMRTMLPAADGPTLGGVPIVVDPIIPEGFAILIGDPLPFDPDDPLAERYVRAVLDFRPRPGRPAVPLEEIAEAQDTPRYGRASS